MKLKPYYILVIIAGLLPGCSQNPDQKIKKQLTAVAEKYIMSQLAKPEKKVLENGIIMIYEKQKGYVIEPSKIYTGLIDADQTEDAIVTLSTFQGSQQTVSEQLIILGTGKRFKLAATLESDMIIISIKDRIITADVPEHTRDNPLFNCPSCREVVKYKFSLGELVKAE
jgi:hypothetical protein